MKIIQKVILTITIAILASCGSSNDVASNGLIQKRKYRKGFYIDKKADKGLKEKIVSEDIITSIEASERNRKEPSVSSDNNPNEVVKFNNLPVDFTNNSDSNNSGKLNSVTSNIFKKSGKQKEFLTSFKSEFKDIRRMSNRYSKNNAVPKSLSSADDAADGLPFIILVILCFIIPPLAILIHSGISTWFWIDLLLLLAALGYFLIPTLGLASLAAVVIALLVVFDVI